MTEEELVAAARAAMGNSHSPYSGFRVGAAVEASSGRVYTGCNVESASFGLSMCAERVAMFKAVSEGEKGIVRIAVVCSQPEKCVPCGACLQVAREFGSRIQFILEGPEGDLRRESIDELLPGKFEL